VPYFGLSWAMKSSSSKATDHPLVLVLSGPSGAGKDFVLNQLKSLNCSLTYIVTVTTRTQRPAETADVHYHFVSSDDFRKMIELGEFLEYASVYGNFYGVPKKPVKQALEEGKDVIIKVDVQGAMTIKKALPEAVLLFLMAPSREELGRRLRQRNTESQIDLERRLKTADAEINQLPLFDYLIINVDGQIEKVASEIHAIITAEKLKTKPREYHL
jgi:guanylate kinase